MLNSLLRTARPLFSFRRLLAWRHRLPIYWFAEKRDSLIFLAVLTLPVVMLGFFLRFAYLDQIRMESAKIRVESARQRQIDLECLAENIYFEARGESLAGQHAVAEVTLNRVASRRFPATVCDVVHERRWDVIRRRYVAAFSWTELDSVERPRGIAWERAMAAATTVYDAEHTPTVHGALFYHARSIRPRWAKAKQPVATIGQHVFYE